jgi:hypothetical protein
MPQHEPSWALGRWPSPIRRSGEPAVAQAVRAALGPFTGPHGRVLLPSWFRAMLARATEPNR